MLIIRVLRDFFLLAVWQKIVCAVLLPAIFVFCLVLCSTGSRAGEGGHLFTEPLSFFDFTSNFDFVSKRLFGSGGGGIPGTVAGSGRGLAEQAVGSSGNMPNAGRGLAGQAEGSSGNMPNAGRELPDQTRQKGLSGPAGQTEQTRTFGQARQTEQTRTFGQARQKEQTVMVGQAGAAEPRIILLILDKVTWQDLLSYAGPELMSILSKSAVALMNVNTATTPGTESGYLTIGAGTRLAGNWTARRAFNRDEELPRGETVEALYCRHTGKAEVPPGEVLHLYSGALECLNEKRPYPVRIGALGEALSAGKLGVAVLGNADTDTTNRQVVTIAMNSAGAVQYGDVSPALLRESGGLPFGWGCDPQAYLSVFQSLLQKVSLFVVEWGDTSRLDSYMEHLPARRRSELLRSCLGELDLFLQGIRPYLQGNTSLLLVSPSPPRAAFAGGQRLMPVANYQPGVDSGGLLVSPTTRRAGIVTNLDIAPYILHYLGVKTPAFFFGAPLQALPAADHLQNLLTLAADTLHVYNQRPAVIKGYILAQIFLLLGGLAGLIYRFKPARFLRPGLYALLFFPLALLLAPALPFYPAGSLYINVFALTGLTALLTLLARLFFRELLPLFAFTGLLVFAFLTVDLCRGAYLNSRSFLGYDPIGGARFYGLGNEYMGIMIGALLLGFGSLYSLLSKQKVLCWRGSRIAERAGLVFVTWTFLILSFFVLFLMASPLYGANFGGAITAGIALSVTLGGMLALLQQKGYDLLPFSPVGRIKYLFSSRRIFSTKIILLAVFVLVTAAFLYFLNTSRSDAAVSHVGRTWELVRNYGPTELVNIARRKMEMNLKLLRYSLWSRVLFSFIFLIALLYFYPVGLTQQIFKEEPGFKLALGGIIAGSLTALLVNDSGVVAAATTMLYGALPLLLLCFQKVFP